METVMKTLLITVAIAASTLVLGGSPASAQPVAAAVSTAGLDLSTEAGLRKLDLRILHAAAARQSAALIRRPRRRHARTRPPGRDRAPVRAGRARAESLIAGRGGHQSPPRSFRGGYEQRRHQPVRSSLRATWLKVRASYWFIPSLLTLFALALSAATVQLDRHWAAQWLATFDWFEESRPDGARAQLSVIAGAMIAIASTVFAITIAAVAYASGSYGPRLLSNFMNDRGNQVSLGMFIATFVFNLMILRVVRDPENAPALTDMPAGGVEDFVPQLSMLVSGASALIAVGVLVYFLHHVPASIRINSVLGGIGRRLVTDIEQRFPDPGSAEAPPPIRAGHPVSAAAIGYIEIIDFAGLDRLAEDCGVAFALKVRTGDFIHPHLPVATADKPLDSDAAGRVLGCLSLGDSRTPTQDLEFLIDELAEIGLRALSPGVNDPFTAVTAMHWMAAALAKLAERDLSAGPEQGSYDPRRVAPLPDDFSHYLKRSFGAMRASAATSPIAATVFLDSIVGVALGASSPGRRAALAEECRLLGAQAEQELAGPALEEIRRRAAEAAGQAAADSESGER
jgi:UrcA family protein